MNTREQTSQTGDRAAEPLADRRAFLAKCGTFAAATPPAIALLLSAEKEAEACVVHTLCN